MNARDLQLEVSAELCHDIQKRTAELLEMERILVERDEDLRYAWDNRHDDTGLGPVWPSCGCRSDKWCAWHKYVRGALEELEEAA